MFGAVVGALLGVAGLTTLLDTIAGTDVTAWFFEKVGSAVMYFVSPFVELFFKLYDAILYIVQGFFS